MQYSTRPARQPTFLILFACAVLAGCGDPQLPSVDSKLLDPNGGFTLFVSNQSLALNHVDIRVEVDGELVVSDYFDVGSQHTFVPFKLSLSEGKHTIHVWSEKGEVDMSSEFDLQDHDVGVATYWYYPKSDESPKRRIDFRTQKGPLVIE